MGHTVPIMHGSATTTTPSVKPIVIDCPVPPSANRLWRVGKGRIYKTQKYQRWLWEFLHSIRVSIPMFMGMKFPIVTGPFDVWILIHPNRKRDADNSAKAVLDAAEKLGLIRNDADARKVTQELVGKDRAPLGCRLIITPL